MRAFRNLMVVGLLFLAPQVFGQYQIDSRLNGNPGFQYHASPSDWRDINMYQLFTDRFYDGNQGNNLSRQSTTGVKWYNTSGANTEAARNYFQGGDWAGIKQKLPYLQGMGVNCIWISGVQMNEQGLDKNYTPYHGYHPSDFYKCEPMFGTFAELKDLIDTAHSNGIYVVVDVVVNHMADLLQYTDCNCNYSGYCENNCGSLAYRDNNVHFGAPFDNPALFHNHGTIGDNDWDTYPRYVLGAFLGTEDLKTEDATVQNELRWAFKNLIDATDCDGFRVDAIKHMEYNYIKDWANDMRVHAASRGKNNFLLFGEYFSYDDNTQASYCKDVGYSFNSTLWFPMQQTLKNVFAYEQGTSQLTTRMNALNNYGEAKDKVVAFMDNHDVDRIALECGSQWQSKLGPALTFLYLATPVPCLYYGTEHGFDQGGRRNGSPTLGQADFQRECMMNYGFQWGNSFGDKFVTSTLYNQIKKLNELRGQYECLRRGTFTQRWDEGGAGLFAFSKTTASQDALIVINTAWSTKTCNPSVSKPDGTVYVNKLNESDTLTVVGGKLNVSINSKESKIYVAGQGQAQVSTSCDTNFLNVTYIPGGGPLASPTGNIRIQISHDGGQHATNAVMTVNGASRTYAYSLTQGSMSNVTYWFRDEAGTPVVDNNNGQNWITDVRFCGSVSVDLGWIGNTYHWPTNGGWNAGADLWVNIESWPQNAVVSGEVVYSNSVSGAWQNLPLTFNGTNGNNDAWHANLGAYAPGTVMRYAVHVTGRNTNLWANNGGSDYYNTVVAGPNAVTNLGQAYHWPENGTIEPMADLWVNIESTPAGAGRTGEVVYSVNGSTNWQAAGLSHNGLVNGKDQWHVNLGGFPALAQIRYAVKVRDGVPTDHWSNNNFSNYLAIVNDTSSSLHWFGNRVNAGAPTPTLGIHHGGSQPTLDLDDLKSNGVYGLYRSLDLQNWARVTDQVASNTTADVPVTDTNGVAFYRVEPSWIPGTIVYGNEEAAISIETWPIGGAIGANLVYSLNNGTNWNVSPMHFGGTRGNNDVWTTLLPPQPIGTIIRYAIEIIDNQSASHWDNNNSADYTVTVRDPNISDFVPPTASYSPVNLTTPNATLAVTLSATDDVDPSPAIYFTTNGSAPSLASPVYGSPIQVTDHGSGVDMTIKFFARDASGNTSTVTSIDVKVNETFTFGGNKPYSINPTLGHSVANGGITIDGNPSDWNTNMLIAIDMANDDPRSLGSNWTLHEAPIDMTHLWAAWDDTYLYVAWQYVDVTDIIDPANAGSAGGGKISSNDGILQWMAIDTLPGGAPKDVWHKNNGSNYWNGVDLPDYQMYMAGSLWQGYISRATNGVFALDDGGVNYKTAAAAGVTYAKGNAFGAPSMWGVGDCDNRFDAGAPNRNFLSEGHATSRDSFYECRIPLSFLQITRAQLESQGIGIMMGAGSMSCMDSMPNDNTTTDTQGVEVWNSSKEWSDTDSFTTPFARVGAGK